MCDLITSRVVVWWAFGARAPGKRLLQLSLWQSFASGFGSGLQQEQQQRRFLLRGYRAGVTKPRPWTGFGQRLEWEIARSLRLSLWLSVFQCESG